MKQFKDKFSVVIMTSDEYFSLIPNFIKLYEKNFPGSDLDTYIVSESKKLTNLDKYNFINSNHSEWSKRLKTALLNIPTEYVLLLLDDYWIFDAVSIDLLTEIFDFSLDKKIDYIDFIPNTKTTFNFEINRVPWNSKIEFFKLYPKKKNYAYIVNAHYVYKRKFLIDILRNNENAWEFENFASYRVKKNFYKNQYRIFRLSYHNNPIRFDNGGVISKGKIRKEISDKLIAYDSKFSWTERSNVLSNSETGKLKRLLKKINWIFKKYYNYYFNNS